MSLAVSVNYLGKLHQIDIDTLVSSLGNFATILHEVNKQIDPEQRVEIEVSAPEKGSFIINLFLQDPKTGKRKLLRESISLAADIVQIVGGLLLLKSAFGPVMPSVINADGADV